MKSVLIRIARESGGLNRPYVGRVVGISRTPVKTVRRLSRQQFAGACLEPPFEEFGR